MYHVRAAYMDDTGMFCEEGDLGYYDTYKEAHSFAKFILQEYVAEGYPIHRDSNTGTIRHYNIAWVCIDKSTITSNNNTTVTKQYKPMTAPVPKVDLYTINLGIVDRYRWEFNEHKHDGYIEIEKS